ncbi:MAG: VanZ family protein [Smithella sp.]|nr:VanZ family protein [Smithella sp.]
MYRLKDRPGLHLGNNPLLIENIHDSNKTILSHLNNNNEFTVEIKIVPSIKTANRLSGIVCIYDEHEPDIFFIGKWKSHTIMRRRLPSHNNKPTYQEVSLPNSITHDRSATIIAAMDETGTLLSINKDYNAFFPGFSLKMDGLLLHKARVLIGNDPHLKVPFTGEVNGLALFNRRLTAEEINEHILHWGSNTIAQLSLEKGLIALFPMNDPRGQSVKNMISEKGNLMIPDKLYTIKKTILGGPWLNFWHHEGFYYDIIINILGFIPLGMLILAFFISRNKTGYFYYAVTIVIGVTASLTIELTQAFMPARSSSTTDLLCNALGTAVGVLLCHIIFRRFPNIMKKPG